MGFTDKLKGVLFEENTPIQFNEPIGKPGVAYTASTLGIDLQVDTTDVLSVESIYEAAGISDLEKSIYKVEEIKNNLGNLAKEAAKAATVGMMGVVKLTSEEVQADADTRTEVLIDALSQFSGETNTIITNEETEIQALEQEINEKRKKISARQLDQEKQQEIITAELDRIKAVKDFIA